MALAQCSCRYCELTRAAHPKPPPALVRRRCRAGHERPALRIEPRDVPCPMCSPEWYAEQLELELAKAHRPFAKARAA